MAPNLNFENGYFFTLADFETNAIGNFGANVLNKIAVDISISRKKGICYFYVHTSRNHNTIEIGRRREIAMSLAAYRSYLCYAKYQLNCNNK